MLTMESTGSIHILWSDSQRLPHDPGPVNPRDIFPQSSAGSLPEEDVPAPHWRERDADSYNQSSTPRLHASNEQEAFRTRTRTSSRNFSRPGSVVARPVSASVAPRPHSYSPVPPLDLHGRAAASTAEDIPFKQQLAIKHPDKMRVTGERTVKNRTIDRINGVARYRKYKALSESIAKSVPPEVSISKVTKAIEDGNAEAAEFPEKLPYKLDETLTIQEEHLRYSKKTAASQMNDVSKPAEQAHSSCSLFFSRARSYSAPGVPGTQQTPRPGVARLQRTVKSGYINEFLLPQQPRGSVYARSSPRESQHSPRQYHQRLAATSASGSRLPAQSVIGEMDPEPTASSKSTVYHRINGTAIAVDIYGGMHPTKFRNKVRAKALAWIAETERKYKLKCRNRFQDRVRNAEKELIKYHHAEEKGVIIKDQLRKKCYSMATQQIKKDQMLELEWLRVEEWNLTKVGNYFHEEYKKELQHAQAQQIYQEMLMAGGPQLRRSWSRGSGGAGRSDQLSIAQKGAFAASNLQQNLKLTTGMQKKMEEAKQGLDDREAQAASHLAKVADMQAKKKEQATAAKVASWTQRASSRAAAKAMTEMEIREQLVETVHEAYVATCHENKALECHYLKPMLITHKVAMHDDLLFPNHIIALGTCLRSLPHVKSLELRSCGMNDTALEVLLKEICSMGLVELRLPQNQFSPQGCEAIAKVLMPSPEQAVENSRIEPPIPAQHQLYATLEVLSLQDNPVGDQGLYALAGVLSSNAKLRSLNLSRTNLTDTSAPALERILGSSQCLESLDLSWNKLGIQSGMAIGNGLFRAKSLTSLHLGWNSLQNSGTEALAEALRFSPDCPLLTLNLSAARMQSAGYLALANMVKHNPDLRLRRLILNFSLMDNVGAQCLMRTMKGAGRQRLRLEMDNCTLKPGEPPEILKETLSQHSGGDAAASSDDGSIMSPAPRRTKDLTEFLSKFNFDLSQGKDRRYVRFLVDHEIDAYTLNRVVWYNVALDGHVLRRRGGATNAVDPFDIVRLGWTDTLPQRGSLCLEVLSLPPEHVMAGLKTRAPREIPEDGSGEEPDCNSPISSPGGSSPDRPSSPARWGIR